MSIHKRIKELRTTKGLSMEALAELLGVTWQTVQHWEREDGTAPKRSRLEKVAAALDSTPEFLLYGEETHASDASWPFPSVSPDRYSQLTQNQKMAIEDWVRKRVDDFLC